MSIRSAFLRQAELEKTHTEEMLRGDTGPEADDGLLHSPAKRGRLIPGGGSIPPCPAQTAARLRKSFLKRAKQSANYLKKQLEKLG